MSLPIDPMSPGIGRFGGTELRALATMDGSLYAANGYWHDSQKDNPALPGAQVYALGAASGSWGVDAEFGERVAPGGERRYQAIGALYCAQFTAARQSVLLASVWDRLGSLTIFSKVGRPGKWQRYRFAQTAPADAQTRSFGQHRDQVTGEELVFAGTNPRGIFSGTYDPGQPGGINWGPHPEAGISPTQASQRVVSFAQYGTKLYATVGWQIYERQDGRTPSWKHVFTWGHDLPLSGYGGLRGLTAVADPSGAGEDAGGRRRSPGPRAADHAPALAPSRDRPARAKLCHQAAEHPGGSGHRGLQQHDPLHRHLPRHRIPRAAPRRL